MGQSMVVHIQDPPLNLYSLVLSMELERDGFSLTKYLHCFFVILDVFIQEGPTHTC